MTLDQKVAAITEDVDNWDMDTLIEYAKDMREEECYRWNMDKVDEVFNQLEDPYVD